MPVQANDHQSEMLDLLYIQPWKIRLWANTVTTFINMNRKTGTEKIMESSNLQFSKNECGSWSKMFLCIM